MKKTIAILLVAVLALGSVFAGFSGSAAAEFGFNLEDKSYGFAEPATKVKLEYSFDSGEGSKVGEGDLYASIKGSFKIDLVKAESAKIDKVDQALAVSASISEAKIYDAEGNYISILGMPDAPDYALSAIDTYEKDDKDVAYTFKPTYNATNGLEISYAGYKAGVGLVKDATDTNAAVFLEGAVFKSEEVEVSAAATTSKKAGEKLTLGASAKAALSGDVKATVAADLGYQLDGEFNADIAVNVDVAPVVVDAYYATEVQTDAAGTKVENYLSAQVKGAIDPVEVTVKATDLINDDRDLAVTAVYAVNENIKVTAKAAELLSSGYDLSVKGEVKASDVLSYDATAGYHIGNDKLSLEANAAYTAELYTAKAGAKFTTVIGVEKSSTFGITASVESDKIVDGATLALTYGEAVKDAGVDFLSKKYGKVTASCKMSF